MHTSSVQARLLWAAVMTAAAVLSAAPRGPNYEGIRSMGMGNTNVAVTTDRTAIFHNPAGLGLLGEELQISTRPFILGLDGSFSKYASTLGRHQDKLSDLSKIDDPFLEDLDSLDGLWTGIDYIPEITVATKNMGFGVYSVWPLGMKIETGHFIPKLGLKGQRDLVFTWAVGIPLKTDKHHFGVSLEYLQRRPLEERITTYSETFIYFDEARQRPLGVVGDFTRLQHGASFDAGFMHDLFPGFRLAYAMKDMFGVVGGNMVVPQFDLGVAYYLPEIEELYFLRNVIASLELTDIWGFEERTKRYEQFAKKIHLGAEIDLQYVAFRGGINQGYPTFGIGASFGPLRADYVYYTEEVGYYAGQLPRSMHVMSLGLQLNIKMLRARFGGDETEAPEAPEPVQDGDTNP